MTREQDSARLGVGLDATKAQIKDAFRRKALTAHPDRGGSDDELRELKSARDRLLHPEGYAQVAVAEQGQPPGLGDFLVAAGLLAVVKGGSMIIEGMTRRLLAAAFAEGQAAKRDGQGLDKNPYAVGTMRWTQWGKGWLS